MSKQPFRWLSNLYCPFDNADKAFLQKLGTYKIGKPQIARNSATPLTIDELTDFNIVGIYTTETAYRESAPAGKITQDMARKMLTIDFESLTSHLAKYLDDDYHFIGRQ
ncbi:MAG TPA: hypothetical protein VHN11_21460 [Xanthobacteraceae bacterium]|jgi:hypothetical protein|nr:hypothetical protein [Xanthobacteraceae bacterium]